MAKSVQTQLAEVLKDIEYLKIELADVKRLEYWLLGLFVSLFLTLASILLGVVLTG